MGIPRNKDGEPVLSAATEPMVFFIGPVRISVWPSIVGKPQFARLPAAIQRHAVQLLDRLLRRWVRIRTDANIESPCPLSVQVPPGTKIYGDSPARLAEAIAAANCPSSN